MTTIYVIIITIYIHSNYHTKQFFCFCLTGSFVCPIRLRHKRETLQEHDFFAHPVVQQSTLHQDTNH